LNAYDPRCRVHHIFEIIPVYELFTNPPPMPGVVWAPGTRVRVVWRMTFTDDRISKVEMLADRDTIANLELATAWRRRIAYSAVLRAFRREELASESAEVASEPTR
jgi:hypothetical protein